MEPIKLSIAVPFRKDGNPADYPGCVNAFNASVINKYLSSLNAEIAVASEGTADFQIQEIEFINGSFTHLGNDDISKLIKKIKEHFNVSSKVRIVLSATSSGFDFYCLAAVKQLGDITIVFDTPTTNEDGLKKAGFISTRDSMLDALDSCFNNSFRKFICLITPEYNANADIFRQTIIDLLLRKPYGICFKTPLSTEYLNIAKPVFENHGYLQNGDSWFIESVPLIKKYNIQIGCGPYTVSQFDDNAIRSTSDFLFYCDHSTDYEALVTHSLQN